LRTAELHEALIRHGIADPIAFAVDQLRQGNLPPDEATLRRWLGCAGQRPGSAQGPAHRIPDIDDFPPEVWGAMSREERVAVMRGQGQLIRRSVV